MPESRWFHAAAADLDGRVYAFGGYVWPDSKPARLYGTGEYSMVVYDPLARTWRRTDSVPPFRLRYRKLDCHGSGEPKCAVKAGVGERTKPHHETPSGAADGQGRIHWFTRVGSVFFDPKLRAWSQLPSPLWYSASPVRFSEREAPDPSLLYPGDPPHAGYFYHGSVPAFDRHSAAVATGPDGRIYIEGGIGKPHGQNPPATMIDPEPDGGWLQVRDALEAYDPVTNEWTRLAPMQQQRQLFAASFGPDGKLYVFGGYPDLGWFEIDRSDPDWERKRDAARARARAALRSVEVYDPETNRWDWRSPLPVGTQNMGAALGADGKIYVVGGSLSYSDPVAQRTVWIYDPANDAWEEGPPLRTARYGHAVAATRDGRIYAIGGRTNLGRGAEVVDFVLDTGRRAAALASVEVLETAR